MHRTITPYLPPLRAFIDRGTSMNLEEIYPPKMKLFFDLCPDYYSDEDVVEKMQDLVLETLDFDLFVVTVVSVLSRFVRVAAQGVKEEEKVPLKCLAYYISEFSLLEYDMLRYPPSLIAASAIFLARYVLFPSHKPWNSTLRDYTHYQPSDLYECVKALHALVTECPKPILPEIREKYHKDKYKCVADKYSCPPSIPFEHFHNISTAQLVIDRSKQQEDLNSVVLDGDAMYKFPNGAAKKHRSFKR
ncbi:cyclin-A1-1-like [Rutidosis leptorrhynchoides]|uniref:cyclin-A1-1-like n=1 Tax=Rutidosis leptorrhynchoides TaxID=125765 RepID=UPI003A9A35AB